MVDYKKMYLELFSKVEEAIDLLIAAQQQAEDSYVESEKTEESASFGE